MAETADLDEVARRALRLLARREHSRRELELKLGRHFPTPLIEAALDELAERNLQSDARFAEAYVRSRRDKGFGPLRIRAELQERGIDTSLLDHHLNEEDPAWRRAMAALVERKFGDRPPADRREAARRARFLAQRGFPHHWINVHLFDRPHSIDG